MNNYHQVCKTKLKNRNNDIFCDHDCIGLHFDSYLKKYSCKKRLGIPYSEEFKIQREQYMEQMKINKMPQYTTLKQQVANIMDIANKNQQPLTAVEVHSKLRGRYSLHALKKELANNYKVVAKNITKQGVTNKYM